MDLADFENDPRLFLFTSLTAGSSHIITATSRLETILKANKIPFQAIDTATDEKARRLWQRRAQKKKLPGLVKDGFVIGDLEEVEEWNEFGELKENIGPVPVNSPPGGRQGVNIRPLSSSSPPEVDSTSDVPHPASSATASALIDESSRIALPGAGEIAARAKSKSPSNPALETPALEKTISEAARTAEITQPAMPISESHPSLDHLSAPGSQIQSGSASPKIDLATGPEVMGEAPATRKHRGSEVYDAPPDEIKRIESESALKEDPAEDASAEAGDGVRHLTFVEPEKTQDQHAKEADDAGKSVDD